MCLKLHRGARAAGQAAQIKGECSVCGYRRCERAGYLNVLSQLGTLIRDGEMIRDG